MIYSVILKFNQKNNEFSFVLNYPKVYKNYGRLHLIHCTYFSFKRFRILYKYINIVNSSAMASTHSFSTVVLDTISPKNISMR